MLKISGTKISLTKGDSAYITINICKEDGSPYILQEGDEVSIQVRHEPNGGELLFNGIITDVSEDKFVWYIRLEDTKDAGNVFVIRNGEKIAYSDLVKEVE